ncbi:MAG: DNA-protecting protein DprA [Proteobacteria bacterium]|nr:MAG: DNA-protecting protein DprA [Pseudomonadota bacterium]
MKQLEKIPKSLQNIEKSPKKLYYKGDLSFLDKDIIAIVGSRRPNSYTKVLTNNLASALAKRNVFVISGGAMGVDALAHKGAYPKTISVMGNSLDIIYPKVNQKLIKDMEQNCLVLSEYEPNTKASPWSFVERNRIVVGLAKAVIIAQADEKSGSMHSAKIAIKQKKPLFVLPQRLEESRGTNKLLSDGKAKLIYDIDKFCDMFGKINEDYDEIIEFCKKETSLEKCLKKFGDKIYEYDLDGKIKIDNLRIKVL